MKFLILKKFIMKQYILYCFMGKKSKHIRITTHGP